MTRLPKIARFYITRLKARMVLVQELLAVLGIAVGVALLFASQVASTSLDSSISQLTSGVIGPAKFQLEARGPSGFNERLLAEVRQTRGVRAAVPILEQRVGIVGPTGRQNVDLIGADPHTVRLAGPLLRRFNANQLAHQRSLALPESVARTIGVGPLETVHLQIGASSIVSLVAAELPRREIGSLVDSPIAIAPLRYAQSITGLHHRITRVFIEPEPGAEQSVHAALMQLAGSSINVEPANFDAKVFDQAAGPINQSTNTFAAICAMVGFMFAFSAMLLTVHLRQRLIRELRFNGATRLFAIQVLLFDALILGGIASVVGLALGEVLSMTVFHSNTGYLSFGFPVGSRRIVTVQSVALAVGGGVLAASVGVLTPLRHLLKRTRQDEGSQARDPSRTWMVTTIAAGAFCLGGTTIILAVAPQSAVAGVVLLIGALLFVLPATLDGSLILLDRLPDAWFHGANRIAVVQMRERASRPRVLAIAATGAIAVFGSVTIEGSHQNLQHGLDRLFGEVTSAGDLWVLPFGPQNLLATTSFHAGIAMQLQRLPGVRTVGVYRSGLLEYGDRRVWVLAPPIDAASPIPARQMVEGQLAAATKALRRGGWAVVSQALARQNHLRIGERFTLPAPRPIMLRVAAESTNLGWPPGAIILNSADYAKAWGSSDPSAYEVALASHYSLGQVRSEIQRILGRHTGLSVESGQERDSLQRAASRQGLDRLSQISLIVLLAGLLATATAMGAMIWQRQRRFARLKIQGYETKVLWTALLCESATLLMVGCFMGAGFGVYGQLILSHALLSVTGMPVIFSSRVLMAAASFLLVTVIGAVIVAVPGYRVARVAPRP
ncbi:MAG: ABC transporter permease [Solirubrobacteraceae bacterium]